MTDEERGLLERWANSLPSNLQRACAAALAEIDRLRKLLEEYE